jgi:hypothetical protein
MNINNKLEKLKGRNPFRVPDGYFESFTENMMSRLPKKPKKEPEIISMYDRAKPWLYMAAAFTGIILLFNVLNKTVRTSTENRDTQAGITTGSLAEVEANENVEFLEYIEDMYVDKYVLFYIDDFVCE